MTARSPAKRTWCHRVRSCRAASKRCRCRARSPWICGRSAQWRRRHGRSGIDWNHHHRQGSRLRWRRTTHEPRARQGQAHADPRRRQEGRQAARPSCRRDESRDRRRRRRERAGLGAARSEQLREAVHARRRRHGRRDPRRAARIEGHRGRVSSRQRGLRRRRKGRRGAHARRLAPRITGLGQVGSPASRRAATTSSSRGPTAPPRRTRGKCAGRGSPSAARPTCRSSSRSRKAGSARKRCRRASAGSAQDASSSRGPKARPHIRCERSRSSRTERRRARRWRSPPQASTPGSRRSRWARRPRRRRLPRLEGQGLRDSRYAGRSAPRNDGSIALAAFMRSLCSRRSLRAQRRRDATCSARRRWRRGSSITRMISATTRTSTAFTSNKSRPRAGPTRRRPRAARSINALTLTPGASDDTIVSATRERAKKLGAAARSSTSRPRTSRRWGARATAALRRRRRDRAARARARAQAEGRERQGRGPGEARRRAEEDRRSRVQNRGADKADEKKTEKSRELRRELGGAIDATRSMARDAAKGQRRTRRTSSRISGARSKQGSTAAPRGAPRVEAAAAGAPAEGRAAEAKRRARRPSAWRSRSGRPPRSRSRPARSPRPREAPPRSRRPRRPTKSSTPEPRSGERRGDSAVARRRGAVGAEEIVGDQDRLRRRRVRVLSRTHVPRASCRENACSLQLDPSPRCRAGSAGRTACSNSPRRGRT